MGYTLRVLLGLIAGMSLGMAAGATRMPWLLKLAGWIEPVGILFVNAIRVAVIPLVVASLVVGIAEQGDSRRTGRLGVRALAVVLISLVAAAVFAIATAYPLLARLGLDGRLTAALPGEATAASRFAQAPVSLGQWIVDLVPANLFKAANDGALLPLVVFAIAFGLALTQVVSRHRDTLLNVLRAISDALLVYIAYVIRLAPFGVFALAMPLAARVGFTAAGALAYYIVVLSTISSAFILLLYVTTVTLGGMPLRPLIRALLPAQAVAFSSRSSMAALPATYETARDLGIPEEIYGTFLPLAAAIFRVGAVMAQIVGVLFLARLYGVTLTATDLVTIGATVIVTSLTVPGVPAGAIIVLVPVLVTAHIPAEGIGVLLAVDSIPDMFRTTANVTGWIGAAAMLGRGSGSGSPEKQRATERPVAAESTEETEEAERNITTEKRR
jgi:Na+/H+-dicarboxylate symporter